MLGYVWVHGVWLAAIGPLLFCASTSLIQYNVIEDGRNEIYLSKYKSKFYSRSNGCVATNMVSGVGCLGFRQTAKFENVFIFRI